MEPAGILWPMVALAGWTFVVLALVPVARFRAAAAGRVKARDFRFGESAEVPGDVSLPNRNLMNLLELPVLFYVVCLAFYATKTVDAAALWLAWGFVALRIAHSVVHLAYNRILHRLAAYAAGALVLMVLWIRFGFAVARL